MDPRFTDETIAFSQFAAQFAGLLNNISLGPMREFFDELHIRGNEKLIETFKGTTEEKQVKVNSAEIPITIYTPVDVNRTKLAVFFHGGGWTVCSRKTHQTIVNLLADATKTIWISVEYRLGPEHKFPIWLDDACDVTRHIVENKVSYGVYQTAKIGVAGDSAGAMISASVCHALKKNIDFQILVYGSYNFPLGGASFNEFLDPKYLGNREMLDWVMFNAFRDEADLKDPRVSVVLNTSFDDLPPALFIVAELDTVRDESYAYKDILDKAGVKTKLVLVKGVLHAFFSLPGIYPKACAQAIDAIQDFMTSI